MTMKPLWLLLLSVFFGFSVANAETIEIPVGQQAQEKWRIDRPHKGMSKQQVKASFGEPVDWKDAVGDPPISSWVYDEYIVYFEFDHVIHTVLKQTHARAGN